MADPGSDRGPLGTLTLAGLGGLTVLAEHADELADELGKRLGVERDEARTAIADILESWRREAGRLGESTEGMAGRIASDFGLATRASVDDLELRIAQLEHRLRLLERPPNG
jgi:polyhydroxyalkanoate synthesis regulator phasin